MTTPETITLKQSEIITEGLGFDLHCYIHDRRAELVATHWRADIEDGTTTASLALVAMGKIYARTRNVAGDKATFTKADYDRAIDDFFAARRAVVERLPHQGMER